MKSYSIEQINSVLQGTLIGNTTASISGPEQLEMANNSQISFIGHKKYLKFWGSSKACAAIINEEFELEPGENRALIKVKNADLAMAQLLEMFIPDGPLFDQPIHPTAVVHPTAVIGTNTRIGAGCYVGAGAAIGNDVTLYANVTILDQTKVGDHSTIWSGAVVRERCVVGHHCIIHPNATIGADGFGFRPSADGRGLVKIPHIGNVVLGNYVEVGSSTCIDRAKFSSTIIGDGTKLDNLVQIGHNSKTGRSCLMAGSSGLAGSVTIGDGVIIGGGVCVSDHVTVGNGVLIGGMSGVISDVEDGKKVLGYPAVDARDCLKQWAYLRKAIK
ncbi:MAG: UDP-3-O-(3-hydroxymyristoyl)glucosamine N-acyltransferase [Bacteroidota bacterium]